MRDEFIVREAVDSDYEEVARLIAELQQLHAAARPDLYRTPDEPLQREVYTDSLQDEERFAYVIDAVPQSAIYASGVSRTESTPGHSQIHDSDGEREDQAENEEKPPKRLAAYLACRVESKVGGRAMHPRTLLFIEELIVDSSFRGSGFGRLLIERVRKRAKELGVDAVKLNVFGFNENAAAFYEALGFRIKSSRLEFDIR